MYVGADWKVDALLNWIPKKLLQITIWASPTGAKSQQLSNLMRSGPALILFTPRNPLYDSIDYYDMVREWIMVILLLDLKVKDTALPSI